MQWLKALPFHSSAHRVHRHCQSVQDNCIYIYTHVSSMYTCFKIFGDQFLTPLLQVHATLHLSEDSSTPKVSVPCHLSSLSSVNQISLLFRMAFRMHVLNSNQKRSSNKRSAGKSIPQKVWCPSGRCRGRDTSVTEKDRAEKDCGSEG